MVPIQAARWVEPKDCWQERPLTQRLLKTDRDDESLNCQREEKGLRRCTFSVMASKNGHG